METTTALTTIIDRSLEIFSNGGQILQASVTRADKAESIGVKIISEISAGGGKLSPEMDARCLNYLTNCAAAKKEMNEARKPITQMMDEVKSRFIEQENRLDNKKPDSKAFIIQGFRDKYALQLQQEEEQRRREAEQKAAKEQEEINIKAEAERQLQQHFGSYLLTQKQELSDAFYAIAIDGYEEQMAAFTALQHIYPYDHYKAFKASVHPRHHTQEEADSIAFRQIIGRHDEFRERFTQELSDTHQQLILMIPSRKAELEQLAQADEQQRRLMEEEQQRRQEAEAARLKQEAEEEQRKQEAAISQQQQAEQVEVLFSKETAVSIHTPKPESRQGYSITVTDPKGWPLIFQFWYEREGMKLPLEKAGKTSLNSMVTFCEGYAKKYAERIESQYISYDTSVKAVNRKATA